MKQLASHFGLTENAIYEWERRGRQTDYQTLCDLADFFGCSVDYLLGREN